MSPQEFGGASLAILLAQFMHILVSLGLTFSVTRTYFRPEGGVRSSRRLARQACAIALLLSVLAVPAALVAHGSWLLTGVSNVSIVLAVLTAGPIACVVLNQAVLRAEDRVGRFVFVGLVSAFGSPAIGLLCAGATGGDAVGYLAGFATAQVAAAILALFSTRGGATPGHGLGQSVAESLPTVPHSLALFGLALVARFLVEITLGLGAAGQFQVLYTIGMIPTALVGAVNNAWSPLIYAADEGDRRQVLHDTAPAVAGAASFLVIMVATFAPLGIAIAAPQSYSLQGHFDVAAVVTLATLGNVAYLTSAQRLFAAGHTRGLAVITPLSLLLAVLVGAALVEYAGLLGAASIPALGFALQAIGVTLYARARVGPNRLPMRYYAPQAIAGGTVVASVLTPEEAVLTRATLALMASALLAVAFFGRQLLSEWPRR